MDARLPWSGSDGDDDDELVILQENKNTKSKNPVSNGAPGSNDLEIVSVQVKSGPEPPRPGLNSRYNSNVFNCDICNLKFPGLLGLTRHKNQFYGKKYCCKCKQIGFSSEESFNNHKCFQNYHSKIGRLKCDICDTKYPNITKLTQHRNEFINSRVCCICKARIPIDEDFGNHKCFKSKNSNALKSLATYKCTICDLYLMSHKELSQHYTRNELSLRQMAWKSK